MLCDKCGARKECIIGDFFLCPNRCEKTETTTTKTDKDIVDLPVYVSDFVRPVGSNGSIILSYNPKIVCSYYKNGVSPLVADDYTFLIWHDQYQSYFFFTNKQAKRILDAMHGTGEYLIPIGNNADCCINFKYACFSDGNKIIKLDELCSLYNFLQKALTN